MINWQTIETAPYMEKIEVKNELMDTPLIATRGYVVNGMVHPNQTYCTYTTEYGRVELCCPTQWRPLTEARKKGGE